jgi:hypothetical protein
MDTLDTSIEQKMSNLFCCKKCDYITSRKSNFDRHNLSEKHKRIHNVSLGIEYFEQNEQNEQNDKTNTYNCVCGNIYKFSQGLSKHKNKCSYIAPNNEDKNDKLIEYLMKENKEMKDLILEIVKNGTYNTNNTTNNTNANNTNSHNKAFNLNFFLNETCKNAMNITDFVDSIKLQLSDLLDVGELGYVEGISKIIVKNLNNLDETERPIHCTDKKRETMYVKDQDQWEKEDEKNSKLTRAVKRISNKNIDLLPLFREKYPEYKNSSSKISDKHDKLVIEVMETDPDKHEKIIRNISKVTTIKEN